MNSRTAWWTPLTAVVDAAAFLQCRESEGGRGGIHDVVTMLGDASCVGGEELAAVGESQEVVASQWLPITRLP